MSKKLCNKYLIPTNWKPHISDNEYKRPSIKTKSNSFYKCLNVSFISKHQVPNQIPHSIISGLYQTKCIQIRGNRVCLKLRIYVVDLAQISLALMHPVTLHNKVYQASNNLIQLQIVHWNILHSIQDKKKLLNGNQFFKLTFIGLFLDMVNFPQQKYARSCRIHYFTHTHIHF